MGTTKCAISNYTHHRMCNLTGDFDHSGDLIGHNLIAIMIRFFSLPILHIVDNKHIRNSSVCNNVRNQNVKEAFVALKKEFKQLGVFTSKEIAKVNPGKLRFLISDYMGDEWKDITVLEDHMRAIGKFDNPQEIFNYLRRYNLIGSINFDLLSVIQEAADSRLLDKRIEEYEKDYHCFLQLSLNDICTAYDNCPDLLKAYPVGLPKFIIYLKSEWGGRKTYEWKELLEGRFEWAKGINIVQIHKNCIVITYAVWPSMAKAVAYDLTNSDVLTDLKTVGVTRVDVSSRLLEFMQLKEVSITMHTIMPCSNIFRPL